MEKSQRRKTEEEKIKRKKKGSSEARIRRGRTMQP